MVFDYTFVLIYGIKYVGLIVTQLLRYCYDIAIEKNGIYGLETQMKKILAGILISLVMLLTILLGAVPVALAGDAPVIRVIIPVGGTISKDKFTPYTQATIKMNGNYTVTDNTNPANTAALTNGETYTVNLSTSNTRTYTMGDVDQNSSITVSDYTNVRLHILGKKALTGEALAIADVDRNGSVTVSDYTLIRLHILKLKAVASSISFGTGTGISICSSSGQLVFSAPDLKISSGTGTDTIQLITQRDGYDTRNYRGSFRFYMSDNSLRLVNELDLETYLYGVLPYEMSNDFPLEALKAQAVCARNFGLSQIKGDPNYDLDDTGSYAQVYKGFDASKNRCIQAVDETRGQILKYGDTIMGCYYSASNGGWTEISQHRWSVTERKGYDQIRFDPYDIANPASLQERIVLPKTITAGNPIQYQKWTNGAWSANENSVTGVKNIDYYLRLCAFQVIDGNVYVCNSPDDISIVGINSITNKTHDNSSNQHHDIADVTGKNDCKDYLEADVNMKVAVTRIGGTAPEQIDVSFTINFDVIGTTGAYPAFFISGLGIRYAESDDTNWYIYRRRYGHGIGLSQRGAQQRANSSDPAVNTYTAILDFYFPDYTGYPAVDLVTVY